MVTSKGSATPSPVASVVTATTSAFPTGFLPLPSTTASATPTPSPTCAPIGQTSPIQGADVAPGTTSAAVTFFNPGGTNLQEFRVTAISQDLAVGSQRDVGWTVVTPGTACTFQTVTITGLDPTTDYVFSVDAVWTKIGGKDGTSAKTVARSRVVRTA
ncbi:hypothetical protein Ato02nite_061050 [Paractinoplanes toevensis]|uniref:Fibronectin type-III domain-containing protein n=1 Tax=Paractinoplanes toevensis TaxID=571911 RepID=A0A919TFC6_9ACTN|nr:hypothetical protein Ato02nite_061050 [Actinoplanes toevensis]